MALHELYNFVRGKHILVAFGDHKHLDQAAYLVSSFVIDNGAWRAFQQGGRLDVNKYYAFCYEWYRHPALDWFIIPDVIGGSEQENNELIRSWPAELPGAPVWHFGESLAKLEWLSRSYRVVCLAPNGTKEYATLGSPEYLRRIGEAMKVVCDELGRPRCKLHGLRMMNPDEYQFIPLSSADSTNAVRNRNSHQRFGQYKPQQDGLRARQVADRIEYYQSSPVWDEQSIKALLAPTKSLPD